MNKTLFIISILTTSLLNAATVTLAPTKDNTLYESATGHLSNGAGQNFFVGKTRQSSGVSLRRAVIAFDIAGNIPAGAVITDVELHLTMNKSRGNTQTVNLHTITSNWGEGTSDAGGNEGGGTLSTTNDATWIHSFYDTVSWMTPGGDYLGTPSASLSISSQGEYTFQTNGMIGDVQGWLDTPAGNFGWILLGDESTSATAQRFASREHPTVSSRPSLLISYEIPQTTQLNPVKDNTLYETVDGSTSNGAGGNLFIGMTNGNAMRRAVLEFDVTSIHPQSTIIDAQLDLEITNTPSSPFIGTVNATLHSLSAEWGEAGSSGSGSGAGAQSGDATWLHRFFNTDLWTNPGGDFTASESASAPFDESSSNIQFQSTTQLINDVTAWVQDVNNNHGWLIIGDEVNSGNARGVSSREGSSPPVLTIQYLLPPDLIFANGFE
ncbi:MAG TPA: DNRLRE domain-containing protein [Gammaproteobacteria bacterium]|nr:DNRLRE domain-containing protein [Xanthomonadales bacterium]HPI95319.1 DNRLRE domain-containing protein [Gammaproteobacteria bacterium]HPQ86553.1 DNRLRE domain-containing protein [Gammaproteobacteria bacterium]